MVKFGSPEAITILETDKQIYGEWRLREPNEDKYFDCPDCMGRTMVEKRCSECGNFYDIDCTTCDGDGQISEVKYLKIMEQRKENVLR